jgi:putative ABC transport system substrate-binding protein
MKRREFITLLGGAAAWPITARAQQAPMPVIGFISSASPGPFAHFVAAFHRGLNEAGYVEGRDVKVEYLWAEGHYDQLTKMAAELVGHQVAVIVASGGIPTALAAKAATSMIPIVFITAGDPVKENIVSSFNRPGGNITGVSFIQGALGTKKLELLREVVPRATTIAVLVNPQNPTSDFERKDVLEASRILGLECIILNASSERDIEEVIPAVVQQGAGALLVSTDPFLLTRRDQIVALAARHNVPTMYAQREFIIAGGLMSYGTSIADAYRQVGIYTGRILKGEKPGNLPVVQPTKFDLVINLKTAKALGLTVPQIIQMTADEVIE